MKNICFQMTRKAWLVAFMVICSVFPALAQTITVKGTVIDKEGEPLIGASVLVKGETLGAATDFDGQFTIQAPTNGIIVVSYVGYDTQEIPVDGRTEINITMTENSVILGEVVAIGYGVVKKSDATGSVAVIKPDDIEAGIAVSTQDLLVGASPGVTVTTNGGNPNGGATIRIRGGSSLSANNNPLVVIDGVPMSDQSMANGANAMTLVNPQDIESLTVLKDASATAIYGSRASNGVIIIQTKKGSSGAPKFNFAANFHVNTARKTLDLMSGTELTKFFEERDIVPNSAMGTANTDWQKEVLRTSFSHDYNLSVSGTVGQTLPYRISGSFTDSEGIIKTSSMKRTTVGINLSPKFFNGMLSVNANLNGTYIKNREADTGAIGAASAFNPSLPVYTDYPTAGDTGRTIFNGFTNILSGSGGLEKQASINPLQLIRDKKNDGDILQSSGNLQLDYALHFLPELHFNLNLGYSVSKNDTESFTAPNSAMAWKDDDLLKYGAIAAGSVSKWHEIQRNTLLDFYINYRNDFEAIKSNIDVMAGYSWQRMSYLGHSNRYVNTIGFQPMQIVDGVYQLNENPTSENLIGTAVNNNRTTRWSGPNQLISFFGRVNYIFDDTYLLTFTLRDDATSRFSKDNRWGLFPSLALGWKAINMPFMEGVRGWWNDLKLRLGWGVTGQQDIGSLFPYLATYTLSTDNGFQYPSYINPGQWIDPLYPNPYDVNIKWEETTTWNIGLDLAFLNNRFTLAADWYLRETKDLLANTPTPSLNTSNYLLRNIGSLRNTGIELTATGRPVVTKDFTWTTGLNIAHNKNKITKLTGNAETSQLPARDIPTGTGGSIQYHIVGEPAFSYLVYEQVYDNDGKPLEGQYVDQNGDGVIDDKDKIIYHSPEPKWTFSWNNSFNYKNWDFSIVLRANLGNYVYNAPRYDRTLISNANGAYQVCNLLRDEFYFTTTGAGDKLLPLSNHWVENASFIRCDNISVGYTFDNLLKNKLNLRLFGVVQNPFVITKYKGLDPEVFDGIDNNVYPRPVTFTLGLVANF